MMFPKVLLNLILLLLPLHEDDCVRAVHRTFGWLEFYICYVKTMSGQFLDQSFPDLKFYIKP